MWRNKKAVIFDLDGTLIDSMGMWKEIDIEYLGRFGVELPETLQKDISGMSFTETAHYFKDTFQIPDSIEEIKATWNEMAMYKYTHTVPLKPGALEFLKELKARGIKTGIATSNSVELVRAVLKSLSIEEYLDEIHTSCEVPKGKPSPDIYLLVAECLHVDPKDCLVFEDIEEGILAGKRAGMEVCAIDDEFSRHMEKEKRGLSDYYIKDYFEVLKKKTKVSKGEYGYLGSKKKDALVHTFLMVAAGLAVFVLGLLLNKMEVRNIFTVLAFLAVLPAAKAFVNVVVLFPYRQMSAEKKERVDSYKKALDKVLYDVVFTSSEHVMHLDCIYVTGHQVIGFTEREKDKVKLIEEYLKREMENRQLGYKVFIATNEKQLNDRMQLRGEEKEIDMAVQKEVVELLKLFTI